MTNGGVNKHRFCFLFVFFLFVLANQLANPLSNHFIPLIV